MYSNSFDHSYDPEKCLNAWMSCLTRSGVCVIEHSDMHEADAVTELDPFGASLALMPHLIAVGRGATGVREIVPAPKVNDLAKYISLIFIQRWEWEKVERVGPRATARMFFGNFEAERFS